jgi:hypothetical protein
MGIKMISLRVLWKRTRVIALIALIMIGAFLWFLRGIPTIEDSYDSSMIRTAFIAAAKTNILANIQVEITCRPARRGTTLFIRGDLSKQQKQALRILADQIKQDYEQQNNGERHTISVVFQ